MIQPSSFRVRLITTSTRFTSDPFFYTRTCTCTRSILFLSSSASLSVFMLFIFHSLLLSLLAYSSSHFTFLSLSLSLYLSTVEIVHSIFTAIFFSHITRSIIASTILRIFSFFLSVSSATRHHLLTSLNHIVLLFVSAGSTAQKECVSQQPRRSSRSPRPC